VSGTSSSGALFALLLLTAKLFLASNWSTTCFSDNLEGEVGDVVVDDSAEDEAQGLRVASLGEEALAGAEDDWEDLQPQFIDEVVLQQRVYEPKAGRDEDLSI
jgi:hypothetical protein